MIVVDGRDAGMIETYLVADHPGWDALVEQGGGVAGVELLLGEKELVGGGLGPEDLREFARSGRPGSGPCATSRRTACPTG